MKITIRDAEKKDRAFLAWVMMAAARSGKEKGFWDLFIPADEEKKLQFISEIAVSEIKTLCHYSLFKIAEADGKPAGALCCTFPNGLTGEPFSKASYKVWKEENYTDEQLEESRKNVAVHFTCMPDYPLDVWIIEFVGVLPEYRRMGIVNKLLNHALELGKKNGATKFQIAVAKGNTPAQNAYAKAGFKLKEEKTNPDFEKVYGRPGIQRLVIE